MKRSTAVRHLREMAEEATGMTRMLTTDVGWPLEEMWVAGELLTDAYEIESSAVVLLLDVPAEELSWLTVHPSATWVARNLGLGRRPVLWSDRPAVYPAWNPHQRRVTRIWTATTGPDEEVLEALVEGRVADLVIVEPLTSELRDQCRAEMGAARRHLADVLDRFENRYDHHGAGQRADRLWRAAQAVRELQDLIDA